MASASASTSGEHVDAPPPARQSRESLQHLLQQLNEAFDPARRLAVFLQCCHVYRSSASWDATRHDRWAEFDEQLLHDTQNAVDDDVIRLAQRRAAAGQKRGGGAASTTKATKAPNELAGRLAAVSKTAWQVRPHQILRDLHESVLKYNVLKDLRNVACTVVDRRTGAVVPWLAVVHELHRAAERRRVRAGRGGRRPADLFQACDVATAKAALIAGPTAPYCLRAAGDHTPPRANSKRKRHCTATPTPPPTATTPSPPPPSTPPVPSAREGGHRRKRRCAMSPAPVASLDDDDDDDEDDHHQHHADDDDDDHHHHEHAHGHADPEDADHDSSKLPDLGLDAYDSTFDDDDNEEDDDDDDNDDDEEDEEVDDTRDANDANDTAHANDAHDDDAADDGDAIEKGRAAAPHGHDAGTSPASTIATQISCSNQSPIAHVHPSGLRSPLITVTENSAADRPGANSPDVATFRDDGLDSDFQLPNMMEPEATSRLPSPHVAQSMSYGVINVQAEAEIKTPQAEDEIKSTRAEAQRQPMEGGTQKQRIRIETEWQLLHDPVQKKLTHSQIEPTPVLVDMENTALRHVDQIRPSCVTPQARAMTQHTFGSRDQDRRLDTSTTSACLIAPGDTRPTVELVTRSEVSGLLRIKTLTKQAPPTADHHGAVLSLQPGCWLSTTAVMAALHYWNPSPKDNLISESLNLSATPNAALNEQRGDRAQKRFQQPVFYMPFNSGNNHWLLCSLDRRSGQLEVYDPLLVKSKSVAWAQTTLEQYARPISRWGHDPADSPASLLPWVMTPQPLLHQSNLHDCGVYIAVRAILGMHGRECPPSIIPEVWRRAFALSLATTHDLAYQEALFSPSWMVDRLSSTLHIDIVDNHFRDKPGHTRPSSSEFDLALRLHKLSRCLKLVQQETTFILDLHRATHQAAQDISEPLRRHLSWLQNCKDTCPPDVACSEFRDLRVGFNTKISAVEAELAKVAQVRWCHSTLETDVQLYEQHATNAQNQALSTLAKIKQMALELEEQMDM